MQRSARSSAHASKHPILAFFRALSVAVRKRRRTTVRGSKKFDIDQLGSWSRM